MRQRRKRKQRVENAISILAAMVFTVSMVFLLACGKAERDSELTETVVEALIETVNEAKEPSVTLELMEVGMAEEKPEPDEAEVEMLACAIYSEAGGDACSDLCRYYVGDVILNRVEDPRFPDTVESVLTDKGQYGRFYWTGVAWPERAKNEGEQAAVERAYNTARALLSGEHSELYGAGYIWQAEFKQGTDVVYLDGLYFGR